MLVAANDLDLPPADAARERVARERLERRLLRREPGREMLCGKRPGERIGDFVCGEEPAKRALALRVEQPIDPRDVDEVDADAGRSRSRLIARSAASRPVPATRSARARIAIQRSVGFLEHAEAARVQSRQRASRTACRARADLLRRLA